MVSHWWQSHARGLHIPGISFLIQQANDPLLGKKQLHYPLAICKHHGMRTCVGVMVVTPPKNNAIVFLGAHRYQPASWKSPILIEDSCVCGHTGKTIVCVKYGSFMWSTLSKIKANMNAMSLLLCLQIVFETARNAPPPFSMTFETGTLSTAY